ncbi:MAG TPA: hypothetical protein VNF47_25965 [Streptosporangiaceae bacterium]|nr:hypothetical protein [Streptosporangiaceae bacterium]
MTGITVMGVIPGTPPLPAQATQDLRLLPHYENSESQYFLFRE